MEEKSKSSDNDPYSSFLIPHSSFVDAHCHPYDLAAALGSAEEERRNLGVCCAASAATLEEFEYCERLSLEAKQDKAERLLPCFAVHPQMALIIRNTPNVTRYSLQEGLSVLDALARQGRLAAVGETGFDLYNADFRETEKTQDEVFAVHLETALKYDLPLVIHSRRAMHKIFANAGALKRCKAVVFHSWSGTEGEGEALLRRGVNTFFSFGAAITLNHREAVRHKAQRCCAAFPVERLLTETDAPFQPLRGRDFSRYADIAAILGAMEALRGEKLEEIIEKNFNMAFPSTSSGNTLDRFGR
jgi:TatD DNase family protein